MRGRPIFVTGTDTGVGKTWVSSQILGAWRERGLRVAGLKAAESGCTCGPDGLRGEDDEALFVAAGGWQLERCVFRFEPAIAPGVAAEDAGVSIDFATIAGQVDRLRAVCDRVLIEGAGGWLAPMGDGRTIESLAQSLGHDVLIVGRAGLGTISHAALTARAVLAAGLRVAGVVLSRRPDEDATFAEQNAREIARIVDVPVAITDAGSDGGSVLDRLGL
jgi:dethiobiotin synthetase